MATCTESAMLKVNSTSSASGGIGSTIIASTASNSSGAPRPRRMSCRIFRASVLRGSASSAM
jgi:hypothetical protein